MKETTNQWQESFPLISCLCITHNEISLLQRAIHCFEMQIYPNKELIIVYESNNNDARNFLSTLTNPNIFSYELPSCNNMSLGEKRNISIEKSSGQYFCQWDDDDWHHPQRLINQYRPLKQNNKEASILLFEIIHDGLTKKSYGSLMRPIEHSILCKKSLYYKGMKYSLKNKGEDYDFIQHLIQRNVIFPIIDPKLYIYIYHGNNTFDSNHFKNIFNHGFPLSSKISAAIDRLLTKGDCSMNSSQFFNDPDFFQEFNYFNKIPFK